ncbi:MAG: hypothetical protein ABI860_07420, partial [Gemmatimonadales bacterium]
FGAVLGHALVVVSDAHLGDHSATPDRLAEAAARQGRWAAQRLAAEPSLGLVIMGHTHLPALEEPAAGRQYLNPGAWFDGFRYAVASETGADLCTFSPTARPRRVPDGPR